MSNECCLREHQSTTILPQHTNNSSSRFREIRGLLGYTQQQLSEQLFLSRNYVAQIEIGAKDPSPRVLRDLEALRLRLLPAGTKESPRRDSIQENPSRYRVPIEKDTRHPSADESAGAPAPTRQSLEALFATILDDAARVSWGYGFVEAKLKRTFPPDEFTPLNPDKSR